MISMGSSISDYLVFIAELSVVDAILKMAHPKLQSRQ